MGMRAIGLALLAVILCSAVHGQALVQPIYDTQRAFERAVAEKGVRPAFLEFLAEDAVIFRPEAVNAKEFLSRRNDAAAGTLIRRVSFADISTNGLLGYTTGEWTFIPKGKLGAKAAPEPKIGQYATVWSKTRSGAYKAILDIEIEHDPFDRKLRRKTMPTRSQKEPNKRGWSVTDSTMNFLRMSMSQAGLGGAYDRFASDDVILLREGIPPIVGRGRAEDELEKYIAVEFPTKVSQFETADMANSWNPCTYADSGEGMEKGNCLHVWKLKDKKWLIVLGVFAKVDNETKPVLRESDRKKREAKAN